MSKDFGNISHICFHSAYRVVTDARIEQSSAYEINSIPLLELCVPEIYVVFSSS